MTHRLISKLLIIAVVSSLSVGSHVCAEDAQYPTGYFSNAATFLADVFINQREIVVASPDGQSRVVARPKGEAAVLEIDGRIGSLKLDIAGGPNVDLSWSPDSEAFFVTENEGGVMGAYALTVVGRVNGRLTTRHLTNLVARKFGHPVRCFDPEAPNVEGIGWLGSSRELLVAAEIMPHSNCDSFGTFATYVVDPWRMTVLQKFTQLETKERFRSLLGPRLLNAPDECVRNPKVCYIPQLHPERERHG